MIQALPTQGLMLDPEEAAWSLREIVALSTLPSLWREPTPANIAATLAGALQSALRSSRVSVHVVEGDGFLTATHPETPAGAPTEPPRLSIPIGIEGEKGRIDVWVDHALRMSDELILNVAANQAAVWLDHARLALRDRDATLWLRNLVESMGDAFFAVDRAWRLTYLNARGHEIFESFLGPRDSFAGEPLWSLFRPDEFSPLHEVCEDAMRSGRVRRIEAYYAPADRWLEATASPTADGLSVFARDVTARKRDEIRLEALSRLSTEAGLATTLAATYEAAFRAIESAMGATRASILLFDEDGVIRFKATRDLSLEYQKAVEGHTPWRPTDTDAQPILVADAAVAPDLASYRDLFARERIRTLAFFPLTHEARVIGKFMAYHDHAAAFGPEEMSAGQAIANVIAIAITRRHAEEDAARTRHALARSDKLAALGMLVSGVAHEIRTPLTIIANNTHVLESRLRRAVGDHPARGAVVESLEEIRVGVARANHLVSQLKRFARLENDRRVPLDVSRACADAVELLASARRSRARIRTDLAATLLVPADPSQVQQVVINLVSNALDATGDDASRVRIMTRDADAAVELVVEDEGAGMTPETRERLFQPLFTTKSDGTGLGLSIVKRILDDHGASIAYDTAPGKGTRFLIRFALARDSR